MPKLVDHNEIKNKIMDGAVKAVAEQGLEGVTTKLIAKYSGQNESYIYRYFLDSNDLLLKTFIRSDNNMISVLKDYLPILFNTEQSFKDRFNEYFDACWAYMNDGEPYAVFYFRYYYSNLFAKSAIGIHRSIVNALFVEVRPYFKREVNTDVIMNLIYIYVTSASLLVGNEMVVNSDETKDIIRKSIYDVIVPNLDTETIANLGEL